MVLSYNGDSMSFQNIKSDNDTQVVIYSTSAKGQRPIHGAYYSGNRYGWVVCSWDSDGCHIRSGIPSGLDITKALGADKIKGQAEPRIPQSVGKIRSIATDESVGHF